MGAGDFTEEVDVIASLRAGFQQLAPDGTGRRAFKAVEKDVEKTVQLGKRLVGSKKARESFLEEVFDKLGFNDLETDEDDD